MCPSISAMCRFVGSEVDLDEEVKKLHALSAAPVRFTFSDKLHLSALHGQWAIRRFVLRREMHLRCWGQRREDSLLY